MELRELIKGLGEQIGAPELAADDEGVCHLDISGMPVSVMEIPEADRLVVWACLGELPAEGLASCYRLLLGAMEPGGGAGESAFSVKPESNAVYLHWTEDLRTLTLDAFVSALGRFSDVLESWRVRLADFRPAAETTPDALGLVRV